MSEELDYQFYLTVSVISIFNLLFGLCSFFIKERLFLSEALISTVAGIIFGPKGFGVLSFGSRQAHIHLMYHLARFVLAVQVMAAGIELPAAYLKRHWASLSYLLGPVMLVSWISTSTLTCLCFWNLLSWVLYLRTDIADDFCRRKHF